MSKSDPVILHHFDQSPFGEKIRVILGFKQLAWRSVRVSRILPRPDLLLLTGGYRRTPVMQIGADIYCDTQIITRELEADEHVRCNAVSGNGWLPTWNFATVHFVVDVAFMEAWTPRRLSCCSTRWKNIA